MDLPESAWHIGQELAPQQNIVVFAGDPVQEECQASWQHHYGRLVKVLTPMGTDALDAGQSTSCTRGTPCCSHPLLQHHLVGRSCSPSIDCSCNTDPLP